MKESIHTKSFLKDMQSLPLNRKIGITSARIIEWYREFNGQVYVAFSGGKDSTVLLHIARQLFSDIEAMFVDTGLEYPEIRQFVKSFDNVTILRPKMMFDQVIKKYGYPVISKQVSNCIDGARKGQKSRLDRLNGANPESIFSQVKYKPLLNTNFAISDKCCDVMKKHPAYMYGKQTGKKPILATMATESKLREKNWLHSGCNAFNNKHPQSAPISFWTEQDVLQYIKQFNLPIASVYGEIQYAQDNKQMRLEEFGVDGCGTDKLCTSGCDRTGCIFCGFGAHLDKFPSRFERLKVTHPKQYNYCLNGGEYNEQGMWQPNKKGLGLGHVFDELNKIYGDDFIKY